MLPLKLSRLRAFSLIEAAIVLAIIGLVLGGLWVAAATVMRKHNANKITEGFLSYMEEARQAAAMLPDDFASAQDVVNSHVGLPPEWIMQTDPYYVLSAPGGVRTLMGYGTNSVTNDTSTVMLQMDFANKKQLCVETVTRITAAAWDRISYLYLGNALYNGGVQPRKGLLSGPIPYNDTTLQQKCNLGTSPLFVSIGMRLKG